MKVAMITNHYYPHISGVATSIAKLTEGLEKIGHEVHIFAPKYINHIDSSPRIHRVPSISLPFQVIPLPLPGKKVLEKEVMKIKPDIIHVHHPFMLGKTALKIGRRNNIPVIFTYHAMYENYVHYFPLIPQKISQFYVIQSALRFANRTNVVIAPSESVQEILLKRGLKSKMVVVPTGINPDIFVKDNLVRTETRKKWNVKENEIAIISIARLGKEKNFEMLIEAYSLLPENLFKNLKLIIGGDGPAKTELENKVNSLNIKEKVVFVGEMPYEEVPNFLAGGDIFAYPSMSETQGLVTLEAQAASLPVIATDAPGNRDILRNKITGLLVNNDSNDFANKMAFLIENQEMRKTMSIEARRRSLDFAQTNIVKKIEGIYRDCL